MSLVYIGFGPHPPIVVPEVGRGEEAGCAATADGLRRLAAEIIQAGTETLVLVSSHAPAVREGMAYLAAPTLEGDLGRFGAPEVRLTRENDENIGAGLAALGCQPVRARLDHGTMVPLYFLDQAGWQGRLVVLGTPLIDPGGWGRQVGKLLNDSPDRCALLASGDLSHCLKEDGPYGFHPAGPQFDRLIQQGLRQEPSILFTLPDDLVENAAQCGYNSLLFALGARQGACRIFSYEGPFGVGYLSAELYKASPIAGYARACLNHYLTGHPTEKVDVPGDPLLKTKRSCFVTLYKDGALRGCIGTIRPVRETLADEIRHNAVAAGTQDPRFWPLQVEELPLVTISVDVLGDMEKIEGPEELDPHLYGVVVRSRGKVGLLLPRLEGVSTVEEQVDIACRKAGIFPQEKVEYWRFQVDRYFE